MKPTKNFLDAVKLIVEKEKIDVPPMLFVHGVVYEELKQFDFVDEITDKAEAYLVLNDNLPKEVAYKIKIWFAQQGYSGPNSNVRIIKSEKLI